MGTENMPACVKVANRCFIDKTFSANVVGGNKKMTFPPACVQHVRDCSSARTAIVEAQHHRPARPCVFFQVIVDGAIRYVGSGSDDLKMPLEIIGREFVDLRIC